MLEKLKAFNRLGASVGNPSESKSMRLDLHVTHYIPVISCLLCKAFYDVFCPPLSTKYGQNEYKRFLYELRLVKKEWDKVTAGAP